MPFSERWGLICVQSLLGGKPTRCFLDTGAGGITCPESLHPVGERLPIRGLANWEKGRDLAYTCLLLPRIRVGDYELRDVPIAVTSLATGQASRRHAADGLMNIPFLGSPAFSHVVLTIDYPRKEVIIRRSDDDITRQPHRAHDHLANIAWDTTQPWGHLPTVMGSLAGRPARIEIDTGCDQAVISRNFADRFLAALPRKHTIVYGPNGTQTPAQSISGVPGSIAGVPFRVDAWLTDPATGADALIGNAVLRHFTVTIDYPRRKLLLSAP